MPKLEDSRAQDIETRDDQSDASASTTSSQASTLAWPADAMVALYAEVTVLCSSPGSAMETDGVTYICDSPHIGELRRTHAFMASMLEDDSSSAAEAAAEAAAKADAAAKQWHDAEALKLISALNEEVTSQPPLSPTIIPAQAILEVIAEILPFGPSPWAKGIEEASPDAAPGETSSPETPPSRRAGFLSSPPRMRRSRSPQGNEAGGGPSGGRPPCSSPARGLTARRSPQRA